jgi:glycine/sarcosine N-methyltransferase
MMDPAMAFYDALAPMFDVMTDWDARLATEGPFLRAMLESVGAHRVLDAACGSGGHALALAGWGYDVVGTDLSPVMIQLARQKAAETGRTASFAVAGLADLPTQLADSARFDAVLCLGNSLPHVLTQEALIAALRGMAGVLRPGGLFITQNLNYDLRWVRQPRFFAAQGGLLDGQEVLVWRFADYDAAQGRIGFNIALFRKPAGVMSEAPVNWGVEVHTTPQRPLFQADLLAALGDAGFAAPQSYGGMAWPAPPFDIGASGDLIVIAQRS